MPSQDKEETTHLDHTGDEGAVEELIATGPSRPMRQPVDSKKSLKAITDNLQGLRYNPSLKGWFKFQVHPFRVKVPKRRVYAQTQITTPHIEGLSISLTLYFYIFDMYTYAHHRAVLWTLMERPRKLWAHKKCSEAEPHVLGDRLLKADQSAGTSTPAGDLGAKGFDHVFMGPPHAMGYEVLK